MTREPVPHSLMRETAWMLLAQAANDVLHPMRIVTMATIDEERRPQARLMVLRGADQSGERIWFHTDSDCRKVMQLRREPHIAIVAYDPILGVQLRMAGDVKLHEDNAIAHDHWDQTNMSLSRAFKPPSNGDELPFPDPRLNRLWHHRDPQSRVVDRQRFTVIEVQVERIEWFQTIGAKAWSAVFERNKGPKPPWTPPQSRRRKGNPARPM